jgi:hypothetical protein
MEEKKGEGKGREGKGKIPSNSRGPVFARKIIVKEFFFVILYCVTFVVQLIQRIK